MASPLAIFATRLSPPAVYFIQTGCSALSNTYSTMSTCTMTDLVQGLNYTMHKNSTD